MIDEMPCGDGTVRTTGVRIRHQVSRRVCTEVLAALEARHRPAQQLQNSTILIVKFGRILNAIPSLQVLSGAHENALAESESTLQSSRGGWEHQEELGSTGVGYRSVWEVCIWLPDRISFLLMYISIDLYSYPTTHCISGLAAGCAGEQFEVSVKMMI